MNYKGADEPSRIFITALMYYYKKIDLKRPKKIFNQMSQDNNIFPTDSLIEECQIGSSECMKIEEKVNNYCGLGGFYEAYKDTIIHDQMEWVGQINLNISNPCANDIEQGVGVHVCERNVCEKLCYFCGKCMMIAVNVKCNSCDAVAHEECLRQNKSASSFSKINFMPCIIKNSALSVVCRVCHSENPHMCTNSCSVSVTKCIGVETCITEKNWHCNFCIKFCVMCIQEGKMDETYCVHHAKEFLHRKKINADSKHPAAGRRVYVCGTHNKSANQQSSSQYE